MNDFNEHKKEIERMLVETIIKALEQGKLTNEELPTVSTLILETIGKAKTHEELRKYLNELAKKWSIFQPILTLEHDEQDTKIKEEAVQKVIALTKENKIGEALNVAKTATNNP